MKNKRVLVLFFAVIVAALSITIVELKDGNESLTGEGNRLAGIFDTVSEITDDITEEKTDNTIDKEFNAGREDTGSTVKSTDNKGLNEVRGDNADAGVAEDENTSDGKTSTNSDDTENSNGIANNNDNSKGNSNSNGNNNGSNKDNNNHNTGNTGNNNTNEKTDEIVEIEGLVELIKLDDSFVIDLKYASTDNFTGKKIYSSARCFIHKNTAQKLIAANNEFKSLGYRIKVFDAYRPYSAQQILWDAAPDKSYVANPKKGSVHNKGAAVDITLVDEQGNELPMPSDYDEMTKRSHLNYNDCDEQLIKNRELLGNIMVKHGFKRISTEWWHFDDTDAKNYPILDIPFESFPD